MGSLTMIGKLNFLNALSRSVHTTSTQYSSIHKTFRKVMGYNTRKKRLNFPEVPIAYDPSKLSKVASETKNPSKRISMLSKMFMRYITDLMINGDYWDKYAKFGIEITRIQLSSDYKHLQIYWITKKMADDETITKLLLDDAFSLRHELSQLRVIGSVPMIRFYKDSRLSGILDLDNRLSHADYGEDYEPVSLNKLKHQLELYSPLEDNLKVQLKVLDENEEENILDTELPEMPQNVLGLNHSEILNRIQNSMKRTDIKQNEYKERPGLEIRDEISSRDALKSFLLKRQLTQQKMNKMDKNYNPDAEYIKEEIKNRSLQYFENIEKNFSEFDDDYIEEEGDEK